LIRDHNGTKAALSALGQQSAEEIGDLQDRKERVGEDARAE
jgi:hypothetical protein